MQTGQAVLVQHGGTWIKGTIVEVRENDYGIEVGPNMVMYRQAEDRWFPVRRHV